MRTCLSFAMLSAVALIASAAAAGGASAQTVRWITPADTNNGKGCLNACTARGLNPVVVGVSDDTKKTTFFLCMGDTGKKKGGNRPGYNIVAAGDTDAVCNIVNLPDVGAAEALAVNDFKCLCSDNQLFPIEGSSP